MGMRQPPPKARPLTFSRGAAWRRLNSARRSSWYTRRASPAERPGAAAPAPARSRAPRARDENLSEDVI
jgi:hypothetical protein